MSTSTLIAPKRTKEEEEKEALLNALKDTAQSDQRNRLLVSLVEQRIRHEYFRDSGQPDIDRESNDLSAKSFPGIKSMSLMVETAKDMLERIQESVRDTIKRLEPAPHERPLTAIHCNGAIKFDDQLSVLLKVTDDLGKVGALVIDMAVRADSKLFNDALVLYHKLREYAEIADQNRLAADNCARAYEIPSSNKTSYSLAA